MASNGKLPKGWTESRIDEVADVSFSSVDKKSVQGQRSVRLCNYMDVWKNPYIHHGLDFMEATASEIEIDRFSLAPGDVLLTKDSETKEEIAEPSVVWEKIDNLILGYHLALVRPHAAVTDGPFLAAQLRIPEFRSQFIRAASGATRYGLSMDTVCGAKVWLPPYELQAKISGIIRSIDEAIEATRAVIDQTRRLKTALLQDLLTNGLRKGAHKKDTLKGIGKVPSHWHLRTVGQLIASGHILEVQDGNHGNDHPKESDFVVAGIPFVAANCIRDGKLYPAMFKFITEDQASSLRIGHARQGDLILTHKGSVGLTAYVDPPFDRMVLTPQTTYYRVDQSKLVRAYLRAYFEDERFQSHLHRLASQSTRDYVGITEQKKLTIPVPPFEEQQLIGTTRDELESKVSSEAECLNTLLLVKSALSQGLLTGRIPVKGAE